MSPTTRSRLSCAFATVMLAACGGGGGDGPAAAPPPPPPPPSFNLSGSISIAPTAAVDSDSNDVNQVAQGTFIANNGPATAQAITSPVLLAGTVNRPGVGPAGNNFSAGDADDWFKLDLVAGQVVELEFASDPAQSDVDLYVVSQDAVHIGTSNGVDTRYECVQVSTSTSWYVNVNSFRGASIYNLRIGAPGGAGACAASTTAARAAPGQLLAKARGLDAERAKQLAARLRAAGVTGAALEPGDALKHVPHLLHLPAAQPQRATAMRLLGGPASPTASATDARMERIELHKFAKRLQDTGAFEYVQPNWLAERHALVGEFPPNDRAYAYQRWHYEQISLPSAMSRITTLAAQPAQRPLVAVIDSGVVLDHPDLAPQLFSPGRAFISTRTAGDGNTASGDDTALPADQPHFHGTHVAGTIGAATFDELGGAGTAPMAQILPLRVFPPGGGAQTVDTINAMLYAARLANNSGALPARRADVINLSLGSDRACDTAFQDVINQVRAAGVIVVIAAGNSAHNERGERAAVGAPANCNGAIAVSALDARRQIARYSNTGAQIAVAAPGGDVSQSTTGSGAPDGVYSDLATFDPNGVRQPSFGGMNGTSMAAPHVAGVMALMRYVNPGLTVAQVDALLEQGALSDDLGTAGRDIDFGWGLINARKAVDAALQLAGNTTPPPAGRVIAAPSSIDFGSFQSSAALDLVASAATSETVASVTSDHAAVSVVATSVDPSTRLGRYTVNVNRAMLTAGSFSPKLTITLVPARSLSVQLTVTQPAGGGTSTNADFGPMYVLLINPDTQTVVSTVLAQRSGGRYTWSHAGYALPRVSILAGGDLDNDDVICQRGEACGAYPVLAVGGGLSVVNLSSNRSDLDFQASPLAGMSPQSVGGSGSAVWRRQPAAWPRPTSAGKVAP